MIGSVAFGVSCWQHGAQTARLAVVAIICTLAFGVGVATAETRVALVIGNAGYADAPLKNPRNDAAVMSRALAAAGFDVLTVMDGDGDQLRTAIANFERRLMAPDAVALFYYAGHGVQSRGENYLIPVRNRIRTETDLVQQAVPLQTVFAAFERAATRMNIVILDACRNNPFDRTGATTFSSGLAQVVAPAGTIIGYATAPGQIAHDGSGDHSPYTAALAQSISVAGTTLDDVFRAARRSVREVTAGRQTPWEHSSLVGAFFFQPESPRPSANLPVGAIATSSGLAEITAWQTIKSSNDRRAFTAHLTRFPNGLFAELAAVKIANLEMALAMSPWLLAVNGGHQPMVDAALSGIVFRQALALDTSLASAADLEAAATLYAEASGLGSPDAMFRLGRAYDKGRGVARDLSQAARWYGLAADAKHPMAMAAMGTMFEYGEGVVASLVDAVRLYRMAADAGDPAGSANLAFLYSQGKGVSRNAAEARRLYTRAADQGLVRAKFNLALLVLAGDGGASDPVQAVRLFTEAAAKSYSPALWQLAHLHDQGLGVRRDASRAADLFLQAIQASHRDGRKIDVASAPRSLAARREMQRRLADRGLYAGLKHGIFNTETRRALVAFSDL